MRRLERVAVERRHGQTKKTESDWTHWLIGNRSDAAAASLAHVLLALLTLSAVTKYISPTLTRKRNSV